ncbi:MmpS family transport accessory protein [Kribbella sp. NBC_01505]|uniref:MmpS family transport accessory protein n=1 Tax=Kribbella sp. NBC_01505 TaxID=2903580 RepID=UPI00386759DB
MKRRVPKPLLIVLLVVVLAYPAFQVFLFGYTGIRMLIASQETHEVVYKVTGTADLPSISYNGGDKDPVELKHASVPWDSGTLKIKGRNQLLSVSTDPQVDDKGSVRCEIWVDGKLIESKESLFAGFGAHCSQFAS